MDNRPGEATSAPGRRRARRKRVGPAIALTRLCPEDESFEIMSEKPMADAADLVSLQKELEIVRDERRRLEQQVDAQKAELDFLRARFSRYEIALQASKVVVYTQDRSLRYTSISHDMLGRSVEDILGRTDGDILPAEANAAIAAIKQDVLANGQPKHTEISIEGRLGLRWYELHVEALRNEPGDIVGLICASVDVTERKEGEAHLRLLLRELTHRSKNLLAVIQAMARQTARHAGSTEAFLDQFGARLQALAASHDLLVRESWYGASLTELIRSQLTAYFEPDSSQVAIRGIDVALKPEAAQNLGLALHEMAANAAKYGALSTLDGQVSVAWQWRDGTGNAGDALELEWREQFGPKVKPRRKKGFGTMVIEGNLSRALNADVKMVFDPGGFQCLIAIPANQILATN